MRILKLPIIVVEGFDVSLHASIDDAEKWLEPWWVRQNEGGIYDALGHRLTAIVVVDKEPHLFGTRLREKVKIRTDTPSVEVDTELKSALIGHLKAAGNIQDSLLLEQMSLDLLISLVRENQNKGDASLKSPDD